MYVYSKIHSSAWNERFAGADTWQRAYACVYVCAYSSSGYKIMAGNRWREIDGGK